jgi:hypothetical protein
MPTTNSSTVSGFYPTNFDSIPSFLNGAYSSYSIQLKNYNSIVIQGQTVGMQRLKIDSIGNLPSGLCWNTNKADNWFNARESGCINFNGHVCSDPGQYRIRVLCYPNLGAPVTLDEHIEFIWFLRVKNDGDADIAVDTNQIQSNPFIAYGSSKDCVAGINETENLFAKVYPNHSVNSFTVYMAEQPEPITHFLLYDAFSRLVKESEISSTETTLQRGNLSSGIYFWKLLRNNKVKGRGKILLE